MPTEIFNLKKPQWLTIAFALILVLAIYRFGRTTPAAKTIAVTETQHSADDGHAHGTEEDLSVDSILALAKKQLSTEQVMRINTLENSISRGDVKNQQLKVYDQLARFWGDSARIFEPYAWYKAELARLEYSEKSLTFAAHLFLENLQQNSDPHMVKWKAMQAKDLFERALKINPDNDSSKVGLGACYLFGNISAAPMEGINKIREVINKDSSNTFAHITLAKGSMISGQYDKAVDRLLTVTRLEPNNLEAILMLADVYERTGDKEAAVNWYQVSLKYISRPEARSEIEKRINVLKK